MPHSDSDSDSLVQPGEAAGPGDSMRLVAQGGEAVQQCVALTGREKFEHMVCYCLTLLEQAGGKICAFYIDDFDDCDEHTLRVIQKLIGRAGYEVSDFVPKPEQVYKGFWAWRIRQR